jgi:protein phosphatase
MVRSANEDSLGFRDHVAVVADGMGGHAAGEVASRIAVETFLHHAQSANSLDDLVAAVQAANQAIIDDVADNPDRWGMGTTLVATARIPYNDGHALAYVHVGDSRLYLVRDGAIRQVTEDHSVADELVRRGHLTPEEAAVDPRRHQLTRALGTELTVSIDSGFLAAQRGDYLILCSDGLSNEVNEADMVDLVESSHDLNQAAARLVDRANAAGGRDNISVIVVGVTEPVITVVDEPTPPVVSDLEQAPTSRLGTRRAPTTRRRWPVAAVVAVIALAVSGGAYQILNWWYYSSYYLTLSASGITLYQGQTRSVLWFQPREILADPSLTSTNLRPADISSLSAKLIEPTEAAAVAQINYFKTYAHLPGQG